MGTWYNEQLFVSAFAKCHYAQTKNVSSRLTLFDITREICNQDCLFRMSRMQNFRTHILSGHSLSILTIVL